MNSNPNIIIIKYPFESLISLSGILNKSSIKSIPNKDTIIINIVTPPININEITIVSLRFCISLDP